ncbi:MAG: cell division protein FtsZ [Cyanobium sp. MAG06]|nr:cell division protein FtsZ [Cyanobium sp. MAG06]
MTKIINPTLETSANIKVIGIGGSGRNAINHMVNNKVLGVDFIAINTDTQDLVNCLAEKKIHIGKNLTKGLGAGMDPEIGKRAAEDTREEITEAIKGADMVFITGGFGGGTFSGASSTVANICKNEGILTVAVATKPFFFEGNQRVRIAEEGMEELEKEVDALISISNDRLLSISDKSTTVTEAFAMCDEVLKQAVEGISEIIRLSGRMNLDFNDIRRILKDSGTALFGVGRGLGENRAIEAATSAISNPLLDVSIDDATGLLYVVFGNEDLTLSETAEASKTITQSVAKDAKVIFGIYNDENLKKDEIKITVIATGFPLTNKPNRSINIVNEEKHAKRDPFILNNMKDEEYEEEKENRNSIMNTITKPIINNNNMTDEDDD